MTHTEDEQSTDETAPTRRRYKLAELMAEMDADVSRLAGWDEMPPVGRERCEEM